MGRGAEEGLPLNMAAVYAEYRATITDLLREGIAVGAVRAGVGEAHATVVVGAIEGCLLQWVIDPGLPIADLEAAVVSVCLDGLRPEGRRDGAGVHLDPGAGSTTCSSAQVPAVARWRSPTPWASPARRSRSSRRSTRACPRCPWS